MMWPGEVKPHLSSAYAAGVRIFDTAPSYGNGLGEKRLGKWSRHFPDTILSTKAGVRSAGLATRIRDFSPPGIERSVRASLRRLGRPPDWLWLHGPGQHEITPQLIKGLRQLRNAGAYANLGLAVRLVDE
jgi:D-threo-aldose 1-dehydrogenase